MTPPADDESRRPWGHYEVLADEPSFKVKSLTVLPGKRLSYQFHRFRSEHWFVISGSATVTLDGEDRVITVGESVDVPVGVPHRVHNAGTDPLVFIEVQHGTSFEEDDIVRLEDDFGRSG